MIWITEAEYVEDYKIHVTFNNDEKGIVDLEAVILNDDRSVFKELVDLAKFRRFKADFDTIVWENGLDLAPEFLYDLLKQAQPAM